MACGVLPGVDKQLCAFERWLGIHLATVTGTPAADTAAASAAAASRPGPAPYISQPGRDKPRQDTARQNYPLSS